MTAYSVTRQSKPRYYELVNIRNKRVVFTGYTERQAMDLVKEFPHLALRPAA